MVWVGFGRLCPPVGNDIVTSLVSIVNERYPNSWLAFSVITPAQCRPAFHLTCVQDTV